MDWNQVYVIVGSNIALMVTAAGISVSMFLWARTESRADIRQIDTKIDSLISAIQIETKDFHGRLCALEERVKGK